MDGDAQTTGASEAASADAGASNAGSAADGSSGGGSASAQSGGSQSVNYEERARQEQSRADRAEAELARLRGAQSQSAAQSGGQQDQPRYLTHEDFVAGMSRVEEMREMRSSLREEFPHADPSLFSRYLDFDSPEALRAAVERSAESEKVKEQAMRERLEAEYKERLGPLWKQFETPAAGSGDTQETGLTLERYLSMSFEEKDALYEKDPELVDRLLATHS